MVETESVFGAVVGILAGWVLWNQFGPIPGAMDPVEFYAFPVVGAIAGAFFGLTGATIGGIVGAVLAFVFVADPTGITIGLEGGPIVAFVTVFVIYLLFKVLG